MTLEFLTFKNQKNLIDGVTLHKLTIHRDERGSLVETLKKDWKDVFNTNTISFAQSYFSVTLPGFARDENQWHNHPTKQIDRFVTLQGNAVVALYDWRKGSPTYGVLNLFLMGEVNGDDNQYLLLIPTKVLHAFCVVGEKSCLLASFPSHLYSPKEEKRIPFSAVNVLFPDATPFNWDRIRKAFKP